MARKAPPINTEHPQLTFTLGAWLKTLRLRAEAKSEVAFYGIALDPANPLYIHDIAMFKQRCDPIYWESVDDDEERMVDELTKAGIPLQCCTRVICHTHPNMSPSPSNVDWTAFAGHSKASDWQVMCILSSGKGEWPTDDNTFAVLRQHGAVLNDLDTELEVNVDWDSGVPSGKAWLDQASADLKHFVETGPYPPSATTTLENDRLWYQAHPNEKRTFGGPQSPQVARAYNAGYNGPYDDDADEWAMPNLRSVHEVPKTPFQQKGVTQVIDDTNPNRSFGRVVDHDALTEQQWKEANRDLPPKLPSEEEIAKMTLDEQQALATFGELP